MPNGVLYCERKRMFCSRLVDFVNVNINYGNVQTIALDLFSV